MKEYQMKEYEFSLCVSGIENEEQFSEELCFLFPETFYYVQNNVHEVTFVRESCGLLEAIMSAICDLKVLGVEPIKLTLL